MDAHATGVAAYYKGPNDADWTSATVDANGEIILEDSLAPGTTYRVKAVDTTLYTFEKIPAGESKYFVRDTEITMPGIFQFTANVKDQLGETVTFRSNEVRIEKTSPPADPTPTPIVLPAKPAQITVPPVTEGPNREEDARKLDNIDRIAGTAKWILAGTAADVATSTTASSSHTSLTWDLGC